MHATLMKELEFAWQVVGWMLHAANCFALSRKVDAGSTFSATCNVELQFVEKGVTRVIASVKALRATL